ALGNVVPQLHIHVIGRTAQDPCWPRPVWGNLTSGMPWPPERLSEIVAAAAERLGLEQDVL
ncbi:MAG: HIT family protein, partial [Anaerolineae bacterium]